MHILIKLLFEFSSLFNVFVGNTFHNEKLRQYEINRMKYYYAVVECDCENTANYLYNELDGTEYEQSRTCFDMR